MERIKKSLVIYLDAIEKIRFVQNGDIYYNKNYIKSDINLTTKIKKSYNETQKSTKSGKN